MAKSGSPSLRVGITTGDVDGIGSEVTAKALAKMAAATKEAKSSRRLPVQFYVWRSPSCPRRDLALLDKHFDRITVNSWAEALKFDPKSTRQLIDINSSQEPPRWVETAAQACLVGKLDALVTGPLSKTAIAASGLADMGHTGILKRVSKSREIFMGFIGDNFNVVLATGHLPIDEVTSTLTKPRLLRAIQAAHSLRQVVDKKMAARPIGLLGLNPHAGEGGMIGYSEIKIHSAALEAAREQGIHIEGPLVPDAAFFETNWSRYSVYVANYHDQGLIPFKMIHGQESGIQVSLGLPFVRTSVDHGTAKDIFGKNKADPRSMLFAIEWARTLASRRIRGSLGDKIR